MNISLNNIKKIINKYDKNLNNNIRKIGLKKVIKSVIKTLKNRINILNT